MKFLCRLFGHRLPIKGWWGDGLYGEVRGGAIDGIGRTHFEVWIKCPRCRSRWLSARFHGNHSKIVEANNKGI